MTTINLKLIKIFFIEMGFLIKKFNNFK